MFGMKLGTIKPTVSRIVSYCTAPCSWWTNPNTVETTTMKCKKCGYPLKKCVVCGKPAQCGELTCVRHTE